MESVIGRRFLLFKTPIMTSFLLRTNLERSKARRKKVGLDNISVTNFLYEIRNPAELNGLKYVHTVCKPTKK